MNIVMPETANLVKWHKKEGDHFHRGDVLLEIETDKTVLEVSAETDGILQKIVVREGTAAVPANETVAIVAAAGDKTPAAAHPGQLAPSGRIFSSPIARRLAREAGIDLTARAGSGPGGRILERDIKRASEQRTNATAPAEQRRDAQAVSMSIPAASADSIKTLFAPGSYEEVALDGMRMRIAARLKEAKQLVPHFYLSIDVEVEAMMGLREELNARAPVDNGGVATYHLSVNDLIVKALALALQRVPQANAIWAEDRILLFRQSDVGVAVAVEGGLYTPVVRSAESKTLSAISAELRSLAEGARSRRLRPEEYRGGASTVSNLGMYGVKEFAAIINPPHATMLAVGQAEQRVVAKNGAPAVVQQMTVTLSCDHRVVDGVLGAQLLGAFKGLIERPLELLDLNNI